jgi:polyisoprenoid-binding protein YceI
MFRANRLILTASAALLLAGSSLPALAQATRTPSEVQAGSFAVDTNHTQVGFTLSHMGFSNFTGRLDGVTGTLTLADGDRSASKLSVSIPAKSFSTSIEKLDGELTSADWFDAAKFPAITFTSTKVTVTKPDTATIEGQLTLHGVTKPITLTAHFVGAGTNPLSKKYTVGFDATGTVKRSDFGVTKYVPLIGDEVELSLHGAFEKQ